MLKKRKFNNKKKSALTWLIVVIVTLLVGTLAYASQGFLNWSLEDWKERFTPKVDDLEPEPGEEEVIDLAHVNRHVMNAINDTVILTVTVSPSNAADQTIIWSSSDSNKVSVVSVTATTARITCLSDFVGIVTITARATQGTATEVDDVTATCSVTYNHPLTDIELELWFYGAIPAHNANSYKVTSLSDIPLSENYYGLEVAFTPNLPTISTFTLESLDLNIKDYTTLTALEVNKAFQFDVATLPGRSIKIKVLSDDEIHEHTLSITSGKHLEGAGAINAAITIKANDNSTVLNTYADSVELILAVNTQHVKWNKGVYVRFDMNLASGYDYAQWDFTFDTNIFEISNVSPNFIIQSSGVLRSQTAASGSYFVVLKSLVSGSNGPTQVKIHPINYSTVYDTNFPFTLTEPVASLVLDKPTVEF